MGVFYTKKLIIIKLIRYNFMSVKLNFKFILIMYQVSNEIKNYFQSI